MTSLHEQNGRTRAAEELWLLYYNRCLFERGIITREIYLKMQSRIWAAKAHS